MQSTYTHFPAYLEGVAVLLWDQEKKFHIAPHLPAYKLESTQQAFRLLSM